MFIQFDSIANISEDFSICLLIFNFYTGLHVFFLIQRLKIENHELIFKQIGTGQGYFIGPITGQHAYKDNDQGSFLLHYFFNKNDFNFILTNLEIIAVLILMNINNLI